MRVKIIQQNVFFHGKSFSDVNISEISRGAFLIRRRVFHGMYQPPTLCFIGLVSVSNSSCSGFQTDFQTDFNSLSAEKRGKNHLTDSVVEITLKRHADYVVRFRVLYLERKMTFI